MCIPTKIQTNKCQLATNVTETMPYFRCKPHPLSTQKKRRIFTRKDSMAQTTYVITEQIQVSNMPLKPLQTQTSSEIVK